MLTIAICDDDKKCLDEVTKIIQAFNQTHPTQSNFQLETYLYPQNLCDDVIDGKIFDVFLLDIEMDKLDGISLATTIREHIPSCVIAFLSSHTDYQFMQAGYKVQALRYISKLVMDTALPEALEAAISTSRHSAASYYVFSHYSDSIRLPLDEIIYVHRVKRMATFVTERQEELQIKRPLKDIFAEINDARFVFVDRSCFVNMDHITRISETEITLRNGEHLPVSRKMMPNVKSKLLRLWGGIQ